MISWNQHFQLRSETVAERKIEKNSPWCPNQTTFHRDCGRNRKLFYICTYKIIPKYGEFAFFKMLRLVNSRFLASINSASLSSIQFSVFFFTNLFTLASSTWNVETVSLYHIIGVVHPTAPNIIRKNSRTARISVWSLIHTIEIEMNNQNKNFVLYSGLCP